jgi:hypothetical protein
MEVLSFQPIFGVVTLFSTILKASWLLHFAYINKGPDAPTLHMLRTCSVSAYYQWPHLSLSLKHRPTSLISFVSTSSQLY